MEQKIGGIFMLSVLAILIGIYATRIYFETFQALPLVEYSTKLVISLLSVLIICLALRRTG